MTTREEMIEALREMVPDRDSKPRILTGGEGQQLIDLASRLPTTCTEAHEPTEGMMDAGESAMWATRDRATYRTWLRDGYRAMERARVEGEK